MQQGFLYSNVKQHYIHWFQKLSAQPKYVWAHGAIKKLWYPKDGSVNWQNKDQALQSRKLHQKRPTKWKLMVFQKKTAKKVFLKIL